MESEKCYLYLPQKQDKHSPKKRQRAAESSQTADKTRRRIYHDLWRPLKTHVENALEEVDAEVIEDILKFVHNEAENYRDKDLIPTGLVVTGPTLTYQNAFFDRVFKRIGEKSRSLLVLLESGACANLKTLLKEVTRQARNAGEVVRDEEVEAAGWTSNAKYFDYDLEWVRQRQLAEQFDHVVIAVRDSEAFDIATLAQAIDVFHSWLDRIPFVLFFGIGVSTENFQESLPTSMLRHLRGEEFDVSQVDDVLEGIFRATVDRADNRVVLGPSFTRRIMIKSSDHLQSIDAFVNAIHYAYMTHFYANCLSILLSEDLQFSDVPSEVFEGARNLPSYRRWVEHELEAGRTVTVRKSLESDSYLFELMRTNINSGLEAVLKMVEAIRLIASVRPIIQPSTASEPFASLYVMALSGELGASPLLRETLLHLKKVSSETLQKIFEALSKELTESATIGLTSYQDLLGHILATAESSGPLRSQHDIRTATLRTTVVSQKIELSKHKSSLSKHDAAYSNLLDKFNDQLHNYFADTLIHPQDLVFHEIFLYDVKSLQTDAFTSRPRYVIERALYAPSDYLNCRCCTNTEKDECDKNRSIGNQPATAILYQLYLESGALINVADLWSAFHIMIGQPEEEALAEAQALFQRGFAELKYFGMIRPTRKKTDHVAKVMWRGL